MIDSAVIDASVGIKLFVEEEDSEAADRLFRQLTTTPAAQFYVPDLFFIECANILWKYVQRFGYPVESALRDVTDLQELDLLTVSTADLLPQALELAIDQNITAYDACYAALAQRLELPLITADSVLADKLSGVAIKLQLLSDY